MHTRSRFEKSKRDGVRLQAARPRASLQFAEKMNSVFRENNSIMRDSGAQCLIDFVSSEANLSLRCAIKVRDDAFPETRQNIMRGGDFGACPRINSEGTRPSPLCDSRVYHAISS